MENKNNINFVIAILAAFLFFGGVGGAYYIGKLQSENKSLKNLLGEGEVREEIENDQPSQKQKTPEELAQENLEAITEADHIKGNQDAPIALIEYSDYLCPFCKDFHETAKTALSEYGDDLMWVYRHFPLDSLHPLARPAAEASECVAQIGGNDAFWTFSDNIIANQENISQEAIDQYALETGINVEEYNTCLENPETAELVENDLQNGKEAGIRGTPGTILLNRETGEIEVLPGAVPIDQVKSAIDSLMSN